MKKLIALIAIICLPAMSFQTEKTYTLKLNEQQLNALWYSLDKSTAEHVTVKQLQDLITEQLKAQTDTTKKK